MSRLIRELAEEHQKTGGSVTTDVKDIAFLDPVLLEIFRAFLESRSAVENLEFLEACWRGDDYESIAETFLLPGVPKEVNIPGKCKNKFFAAMPEAWRKEHLSEPESDQGPEAEAEVASYKALEDDDEDISGDTASSIDEDDTYRIEELARANANELKEYLAQASDETKTIIDRNYMSKFTSTQAFADYCFSFLGGPDAIPAMMVPFMSPPDPDRPKNPEEDKERLLAYQVPMKKLYVGMMLGGGKKEGEIDAKAVKAVMGSSKDVPMDDYLEKVKKYADKKIKVFFQKQDQDKEEQRPMRVAETEEEFLAGYKKLENAFSMAWVAGNRKKAAAILGLISEFAAANGKPADDFKKSAMRSATDAIGDKQSDRHFDALTNPEAEADDIPPPPPDDDMPPPPPEDADDDDDIPPPPPFDDTPDDGDQGFDQTEEWIDADDIPPPPSDGPPPLPPRPTDKPAEQEQAADRPPFVMPASKINNKITEAIQARLSEGDVADAVAIAERTVMLFKEKGWVHADTTAEDVVAFAKGAMETTESSRYDIGTAETTEEENERLAKTLLQKFKMEKFRKHYVSKIDKKEVNVFDEEIHALAMKLIKDKGKIVKLLPKAKLFMNWANSMKVKMKIANHKHLIALIFWHLEQIQQEGSLKEKVQKAEAMEIWDGDES